jgi:hypothetical protein
MDYQGPERRSAFPLTDEQIEAIAERAAERALEKVYASIGKSVVQKVLWVVGAASLAVFAYFKGLGKI